MRFTEFFQTIPAFALAIVIVAILQPSLFSIVLAIAIVSWPPVARLVRGEVLSLRTREYVQASIVIGQTTSRIILTQVLPNTIAPITVMASIMVASAILLESALSFLGLGDPNMMTWGYMIGAGRTRLIEAWWISFFPGVAIFLTVLALNLVGEGLKRRAESASLAGGWLMSVLAIDNLSLALPKLADRAHAVQGLSLSIDAGETLCVVGESGSGKSMTAHCCDRAPAKCREAGGRLDQACRARADRAL